MALLNGPLRINELCAEEVCGAGARWYRACLFGEAARPLISAERSQGMWTARLIPCYYVFWLLRHKLLDSVVTLPTYT